MENKILSAFDWSELKVENVEPFSAVKDLAYLANAVYYQTFQSKSIPNQKNQLSNTWILVATARNKLFKLPCTFGDGYHGAAYYDVRTNHLVVAHRGTDLKNLGAGWTDVKGVTFSGNTSQMKSAYKFTKFIVDKFWECAILISVTGHSLGGWLSQTSAFLMKYPDLAEGDQEDNFEIDEIWSTSEESLEKDSHHLHVISFDSPGAFNILQYLLRKTTDKYPDDRLLIAKYLNYLDVTTYFSYPSRVNSVKLHIGSLFMMPTIDSHKMEKILSFWQSNDFDEKSILKVTDWSWGILAEKYCNTEPIDLNSVRMSIFEMKECEFFDDIRSLKTHGVDAENISWERMFEGKDLSEVNKIFCSGKFKNSTQAKNVFDFFDSFQVIDSQVLKVDTRFKLNFFTFLVKHFVKNNKFDLHEVVRAVISETPKVYQAIYRASSADFLKNVPKIQVNNFTALQGFQEFFKSSECAVYQAVAPHSTLNCIAKIYGALKSQAFSVAGFSEKNALLLSSDLLTILDRHVEISRIVPSKDGLKLILIENSNDPIDSKLQSLIEMVVKSSPSVKLILVTSKTIDFQNFQINYPQHFIEKNMTDSDQAISFQDLTNDQQSDLTYSEICFQGEDMPLKNLVSLEELQSNADALDQSALVSILSHRSKVSFRSAVCTLTDFERSYYIPRHFHKLKLKPQRLFSFLNDKKFVVVISYDGIDAKNHIKSMLPNIAAFEWQGSFEGFLRNNHKVVLVDIGVTSPNYYTFRSHFQTIKFPGIWLAYNANDEWYWQANFGQQILSLQSLVFYGDDEKCDEQELFEIRRQLFIVSDEPGMGKSTVLKNFAEKCKTVGRDIGRASWVIFINLESFKDLLIDFPTGSLNISLAIDFLSRVEGSTAIGTCLLKFLLQQDGRVTIFFDGLDEVTKTIQVKVCCIARALLNDTRAKVYIGARLHLRYYLQSFLHSRSSTFVLLAPQERIDFLAKFWTNHFDFSEIEKTNTFSGQVISYATRLLQELSISLNAVEVDSFIGVPLQLFMLCSISLPYVRALISKYQTADNWMDCDLEEHMINFKNIFNLYKMYVDEKCRISLEEKCKFTQLSEHYPWHNRILIDAIIERHRIISFFFLFPNESKVFFSNNILTSDDLQMLLGVGIVHSVSVDLSSIQFIHRSLAEYFAADFLVSRLKMPLFRDKVVDFLRNNLFLPHFDKIRYFVDHFISIQPECDPIFRKCLDWQKEERNIYTILENYSEDRKVVDLLGRNVLHYAVCYGDHDSGILWILIQNQHLFGETDEFRCGFFSYHALSPTFQDYLYQRTNPSHQFSEYLRKIKRLDLSWIARFSGQEQKRFWEVFKNECFDSYRSECKQFRDRESRYNSLRSFFDSPAQIQKFLKLVDTERSPSTFPLDLICFAMRGKYQERNPLCYYAAYEISLYSPEKLFLPFEISITISGKSHIAVALEIYTSVKRPSSIAQRMLDIMTRNNFALYKNCIEFICNQSAIEFDLWLHCNSNQKNEMFDVAAATNFLTLRRAVNEGMEEQSEGIRLVNDFFQICEIRNDEKIRNEMLEIVREDDDEAFMNAFYSENLIYLSIWKLLPIADTEQVVEKYYYNLECVIERIDQLDESDKSKVFLSQIYFSVGADWQKTIKKDCPIDFEVYRGQI